MNPVTQFVIDWLLENAAQLAGIPKEARGLIHSALETAIATTSDPSELWLAADAALVSILDTIQGGAK
jgi:hypothetical protein